jgi:DNA-binding transcriptional ArsR family regulator
MPTAWEALADPTRREIVQQLARQDHSAGEIAELFAISRPGVSKHLRVLREAGLVRTRAEAQSRVYSLDPAGLGEIERWCSEITEFWSGRLGALGTEIARGKRDRARSGRTAGRQATRTQEERTA